jgi:hypothetical protein
MATTTNYGWTTPDDTALVKDGAAAIRTLGSSVDTTTKALNPSTTLGDIEYRSSTANTNTRLGIGTTGQVLTVAAGVPSWATSASGGMTLLSTTTLSGATTTISSINGTYISLIGFIFGANISVADYPMLKPNGASSTNNSTLSRVTLGEQPDDWLLTSADTSMTASNTNNVFSFRIDNYANATNYKAIHWFGTFARGGTGNNAAVNGSGGFKSSSAITSLDISCLNGATYSAGTVLLYGVK